MKKLFKIIFLNSKLTIQDKVDIIKEHLDKVYLFDTENIVGGSVFLRDYNKFITE